MEHNVINLTKRKGDEVHELAAAQDIVRAALQVAEEQGARRVTAIALKVGRLYGAEQLQDLIAISAQGTIAEGATVDVEAVPGAEIHLASIDIE
jgi:Zn finger protein HypA/HybF involved in hydrogenase expression